MDYKIQTFEWDISGENAIVNTPIGISVELSQNPGFYPITFTLNTFDEVASGPLGRFYYSIDDGGTWLDYPLGNAGMTFSSDFKIRLEVHCADTNFLYLLNDGSISKYSGDGTQLITNFDSEDSTLRKINIKNNVIYASGESLTLKKINYKNQINEPYSNSVNLKKPSLDVEFDFSRKIFYQINYDSVEIKTLNGELLGKADFIGNLSDYSEAIDVDFSSSSSSSSSSSEGTSSSSSSSEGTSSSSSSEGTSSSSSSSEGTSSSSSSSEGTSSSSSSESIGNTSSSSSSEGTSSSSSSSSEGTSSSSSSSSEGTSSSSSSSSEGTSSSSSSSEDVGGLAFARFGIESTATPDYDYDDFYMDIFSHYGSVFYLDYQGTDSNGNYAYKIKITSGNSIKFIFNCSDATSTIQRITIYINGVQHSDQTFALGTYSTEINGILSENDVVSVRFRGTSSMDIYNYEIHGDGKVRAKLLSYN